jgi:hypothetical protein
MNRIPLRNKKKIKNPHRIWPEYKRREENEAQTSIHDGSTRCSSKFPQSRIMTHKDKSRRFSIRDDGLLMILFFLGLINGIHDFQDGLF